VGAALVHRGDTPLSAYFSSVNRNKRSLTLNLKTEGGRNLARQLATQSDILIENFKPGQMAGFRLGYADLHPLNPSLVYCSITGFGQTGPYRDRPGYDYVIQAMSGLMSITGETDGAPTKVGVAVSDVFTGLCAATAILAAVHHRDRTGEGQYIDLALLDSQLAALVNIASNYLISGETPGRLGNAHPNIVPYQTFRAADSEFVVAVGNDRQFAQLCAMIGRSDLAADPRYATNPLRVENRDSLIPTLQLTLQQRPASAWVDRLLTAGVPAAPICSVNTALDNPQVAARGLIPTFPVGDDLLRIVGSPLGLSATPPQMRLPPPELGQHTDDILYDWLHLDTPTIAAYRAAGVI
jgi:crotonobetainyl-CoA:carnitine CoA-transferase CaiB-like acyl-CoA transferase